MIKVKRLSTIDVLHGSSVCDYELPTNKRGSYIVDDSHFCPMSEAVKQLANSRPLTDEEIAQCYDFTNGFDNGMQIPVQRMAGIADITEMTEAITSQARDIAKKLEVAKDKKSYQDKINALVKPVPVTGSEES